MLIDWSTEKIVEDYLQTAPEGRNTKFLRGAHNLWKRFKNYDKQPPLTLYDLGEPVAYIFATRSNQSKYMNLYDIVTAEGKEGNGYASSIWDFAMNDAYHLGMKRLKISCTPDSIGWHLRNGLVFWAVDPSGSLRSDQPLFPSREEQLKFRENAVKDPFLARPTDTNTLVRLQHESLDSHGFGAKKRGKVEEAIDKVGPYWLRESLFRSPLDEFMN